MKAEQCKHTRTIGALSMHRCRRRAVKDGYCTRHHPNYVSPKVAAALAEYDRENDPAYRAQKWLDEAVRNYELAREDAEHCLQVVADCEARLLAARNLGDGK